MIDMLAVVYAAAAFVLAVPGLLLGGTDPIAAVTLLWIAFGCAIVALLLNTWNHQEKRRRKAP